MPTVLTAIVAVIAHHAHPVAIVLAAIGVAVVLDIDGMRSRRDPPDDDDGGFGGGPLAGGGIA